MMFIMTHDVDALYQHIKTLVEPPARIGMNGVGQQK